MGHRPDAGSALKTVLLVILVVVLLFLWLYLPSIIDVLTGGTGT